MLHIIQTHTTTNKSVLAYLSQNSQLTKDQVLGKHDEGWIQSFGPVEAKQPLGHYVLQLPFTVESYKCLVYRLHQCFHQCAVMCCFCVPPRNSDKRIYCACCVKTSAIIICIPACHYLHQEHADQDKTTTGILFPRTFSKTMRSNLGINDNGVFVLLTACSLLRIQQKHMRMR